MHFFLRLIGLSEIYLSVPQRLSKIEVVKLFVLFTLILLTFSIYLFIFLSFMCILCPFFSLGWSRLSEIYLSAPEMRSEIQVEKLFVIFYIDIIFSLFFYFLDIFCIFFTQGYLGSKKFISQHHKGKELIVKLDNKGCMIKLFLA